MYTVYILYSKKIDQYYTGHTSDRVDRLSRHNLGKSLAIKRGVPWELKWTLACETRSKAMKVENWIKQMKSRKFIEAVIRGEINVEKKIEGMG